ncbi:TPA: hypothetical protein DCR49_11110 [Candidatus Delongbacteria bacterium]|nr:MAG: hypothetical protein A2Y39_01375 [Candidatus Delongbacteria bacterium GWF2_40_14]HAQ62522.1 hypothetical protein [Candidatus Delongbacteria bacterium]
MKELNVAVIHDASIFHEDILIGVNTQINYEPNKLHISHMLIKNQILKQIGEYEKNPQTYQLAMKLKSNLADLIYCHKEGIIGFEDIEAGKDSTNAQFDNKIVSTGFNMIKKGEVDIVFIATKFGVIKYNVNTLSLENDLNITTVSSQLEYHNKFNRFLANIKDDYIKHHKLRVRIVNEIKVREDMFKYPEED